MKDYTGPNTLLSAFKLIRQAIKSASPAAGEGLSKEGDTLNVDLPTKSVTKTEYEALTEEQKQAEAVYLVAEPPWMPVPLSIQEYDTDDGWHVRKWSDGYVEMSLLKKFTSESTMSSWNGWRMLEKAIPHVDLPIPLVSRRNENAFIVSPPSDMGHMEEETSAYMLLQRGLTTLTQTCAYSFVANDDFHSTELTILISVTGSWK